MELGGELTRELLGSYYKRDLAVLVSGFGLRQAKTKKKYDLVEWILKGTGNGEIEADDILEALLAVQTIKQQKSKPNIAVDEFGGLEKVKQFSVKEEKVDPELSSVAVKRPCPVQDFEVRAKRKREGTAFRLSCCQGEIPMRIADGADGWATNRVGRMVIDDTLIDAATTLMWCPQCDSLRHASCIAGWKELGDRVDDGGWTRVAAEFVCRILQLSIDGNEGSGGSTWTAVEERIRVAPADGDWAEFMWGCVQKTLSDVEPAAKTRRIRTLPPFMSTASIIKPKVVRCDLCALASIDPAMEVRYSCNVKDLRRIISNRIEEKAAAVYEGTPCFFRPQAASFAPTSEELLLYLRGPKAAAKHTESRRILIEALRSHLPLDDPRLGECRNGTLKGIPSSELPSLEKWSNCDSYLRVVTPSRRNDSAQPQLCPAPMGVTRRAEAGWGCKSPLFLWQHTSPAEVVLNRVALPRRQYVLRDRSFYVPMNWKDIRAKGWRVAMVSIGSNSHGGVHPGELQWPLTAWVTFPNASVSEAIVAEPDEFSKRKERFYDVTPYIHGGQNKFELTYSVKFEAIGAFQGTMKGACEQFQLGIVMYRHLSDTEVHSIAIANSIDKLLDWLTACPDFVDRLQLAVEHGVTSDETNFMPLANGKRVPIGIDFPEEGTNSTAIIISAFSAYQETQRKALCGSFHLPSYPAKLVQCRLQLLRGKEADPSLASDGHAEIENLGPDPNSEFWSMTDPVTFQLIDIPIRGSRCEHPQPLCLLSYVFNTCTSHWPKYNRFRCPTCNQDIMFEDATVDFAAWHKREQLLAATSATRYLEKSKTISVKDLDALTAFATGQLSEVERDEVEGQLLELRVRSTQSNVVVGGQTFFLCSYEVIEGGAPLTIASDEPKMPERFKEQRAELVHLDSDSEDIPQPQQPQPQPQPQIPSFIINLDTDSE